MSIRGSVTLECDSPGCHAEQVIEAEDFDIGNLECGVTLTFAAEWLFDDVGRLHCPQCCAPDERDEAYERAAARARNNDFADTGGKDWT